jgi:hypothetical protein
MLPILKLSTIPFICFLIAGGNMAVAQAPEQSFNLRIMGVGLDSTTACKPDSDYRERSIYGATYEDHNGPFKTCYATKADGFTKVIFNNQETKVVRVVRKRNKFRNISGERFFNEAIKAYGNPTAVDENNQKAVYGNAFTIANGKIFENNSGVGLAIACEEKFINDITLTQHCMFDLVDQAAFNETSTEASREWEEKMRAYREKNKEKF